MAIGSVINASKKNKKPTNYQQLLGGASDFDKMYSTNLDKIAMAKGNYASATTDEDRAYWNNYANNLRKEDGYYGGVDGSEFNPVLNLPKYQPFEYEDFSYDVDKDKSYQIYADKFKREGQGASERALANTSAATGGMPSSFAAAANAQTQQAYAKKTADMIPLLEQQAFDRYSNNREFDYRDYLNEYKFGREDAMLMNDDMWNRKTYDDSRTDLKERFDYEKFFNEQNRGDKLAQLDIDNKYRQSRFDWDIDRDTRDYNRNVFTQDRAYNYNEEQDTLNREDREKQRLYEINLKNLEANYPNTVMGQLEAKEAEKLKEQEAIMQAEKEENTRLWIADLSKARNPMKWLEENVGYMTSTEREEVINFMKATGYLK